MTSSTPSKQPPKKFEVGGFAYVICGKGYRGALIKHLNCTKEELGKPLSIRGVDEKAKKIYIVCMSVNRKVNLAWVKMKHFTAEPNDTAKSSSAKTGGDNTPADNTAAETVLVGAGGLAACF